MKQQKLIVVSLDALFSEDLAYLAKKPTFGHILENCALVENLRSIYPTLTYPCHATMATGCLPAKHGVVNNYAFTPGSIHPAWNWYHDSFKVPDLIDAAHERGLTTAAVGWPTMGNHPHVNWIVSEIAGTNAKVAEELRRDYLATGTTPELWEQVGAPHVWMRETLPAGHRASFFNNAVCCEIIRRFQPDLTLLHIGNVDHFRHVDGIHGQEVLVALDECESFVSDLLQAVRDAGIEDCTNIVLTADHCQMDVERTACPNVLLARNGWIDLAEDGSFRDWRAWCQSTGMCSEVYVKDPADEDAVFELLNAHTGLCGWSKVYTREELAEEGFLGDFAFVLETDNRSTFGNQYQGDCLVPLPKPRGSHGYHPDKGSCPPIVAIGPAFRKGAVLPKARLQDGAPTWAKLLGCTLPDADGRVLHELLNGL